MTVEQTEKANSILEDIKELKKFKSFPKKDTVHFEIAEHYGNGAHLAIIPKRYNDRLITLVDTFISELEKQLSEL